MLSSVLYKAHTFTYYLTDHLHLYSFINLHLYSFILKHFEIRNLFRHPDSVSSLDWSPITKVEIFIPVESAMRNKIE